MNRVGESERPLESDKIRIAGSTQAHTSEKSHLGDLNPGPMLYESSGRPPNPSQNTPLSHIAPPPAPPVGGKSAGIQSEAHPTDGGLEVPAIANPDASSAHSASSTLPPTDPALARVVEAWASLPEAVRACVMAIVDAASTAPSVETRQKPTTGKQ
jgi:hypothetical protein